MNNFDKNLKKELNKITEDTYPSDFVKNKIDLKIKNMEKGEYKMKKNKLALVACVALVLSISVYAAGKITGTVGYSSSSYDYTEFVDVEKAEKKANLDANIPENLGRYKFEGLRIVKMADLDENNKRINKRKAINVEYKNEEDKTVDLYIDRVFENEKNREHYNEKRNINGVDLYYTRVENLFLKDESSLTESERERMETDPFFNVAYGNISKDRVESVSKNIIFEKDGIKYSLLTFDDIDANEYFEIASSIIK